MAEAQKRGGLAAFVDAEHALDPDYAKRLGVKVNELLISQPDTGEQALEIVDSLVRSGSVDAIVIDSVAALTPQAEIEGEMGQQHIGLQARLMSHALRKLTAVVSKSKTSIIFINQIRMQIGIMFGNPETTPGGRALKFYSSVRIDLRRAAQIKKGEEIVGNRVNAKVVKNKVAAPFRRAEFDIFYNEGISKDAELLTLGEKYGVVKKSGASYTYEGTRLGQGFDNARMFLKQNPKLAEDIGKKIKEAMAAPAGE
jgi:recombination protein RecA